ncbi:TolB family protein [Sphingomonas mali]|uniref:TolB family protein n=1 Tax=Sphingomonas mali TaxID=40682 RepID=UPI000836D49C|nr:PD40 domain-containing protein [Sphingomonas mali]
MISILALSLALAPASDALVRPGVISTAAAEVRIAHSPDGRRILWGTIGRDAAADQQDIWEIHRIHGGWSTPARVSFDTDAAEFDPAFSPDGRWVYFQSDRAGGLGGSDLYVVSIDAVNGRFGTPRNLGPQVNTPGEEWAATPTRSGGLIFSSNGWGGRGKQDLYEVDLHTPDAKPANLGSAINGPLDELDAAITPDGRALVFSVGDMDADAADVRLFVSYRARSGWTPRRPLGIGCSPFVLGAAIDQRRPWRLYYAAHCADSPGRMDVHVSDLRRVAEQPAMAAGNRSHR